ncbi:hypothetical protein GQ44DRAFT_627959 [Phaeosphaeriaceae sp. PMI808]|nr:hypothetical protein GQ44DRAFT_627959 [Phaeosphaeriaceae sp. PMI808]
MEAIASYSKNDYVATARRSDKAGANNPLCEACRRPNLRTFFCANCDCHLCYECWPLERPHQPGKVGPDGLPHERADIEVVSRLKATFNPPLDPAIQERMHLEDGDTTWFGIAQDGNQRPIFLDHGRYATLIANSASSRFKTRFPRLVSFIGQTGAGKSTIVKMLIERQRNDADTEAKSLFPCPVVGTLTNDWIPTSGDVHLYAAPSSYFTLFPTLYADCEGLEGGEITPIGSRPREGENDSSWNRDSSPDRNRVKKRWRLSRGQQRDIAWADSPDKQKRQYGVTELYPRLLYAFSDVVVFVLQNPKTFESTVLSQLLGWAAAVVEKSTNQPVLPHAIIALNSTDSAIDLREWDVDFATNSLLNSVAGAVGRDPKYREYAEYWDLNGKPVMTMRDLLECYYSSIRVVRIPRKGRYMQVEEQIQKLHEEIESACQRSYHTKRKSRMLANSDELNQYLQAAFDHFSQNLDTPFNFIDMAFKNSPIPRDFGGSILKLAVAVQDVLRTSEGPETFQNLSPMVASCIVLDCTRNGLKGSAKEFFKRNYQSHCDDALRDFCKLFWPCGFKSRAGQCVNVLEGHQKGHQNEKGKIIGLGGYQSAFNFDSYVGRWRRSILTYVAKFQRMIVERMGTNPSNPEKDLVSELHRTNVREFYHRLTGSLKFISHSACFCCLRHTPEHPLPCGHVLCTLCVKTYSELDLKRQGRQIKDRNFIQLERCPLKSGLIHFTEPWYLKFKPELAGVRILSLDGGGIRGIIELEVLRDIESYLGGQIPVQDFFDLIVGTSTGAIIAVGLGVERWRVDTCIRHFRELSDKAFTARLPGIRFGRKYRTRPFEQILQQTFKDELLFGGEHDESSSYFTKVAITATTDTGERPVIFTNYNREIETHRESIPYNLVRPDYPEYELKLWEVLRASSAAPGYFRPFVKDSTKEGYLDGALYHNNPVRVAYHESKLLWPDVQDRHPDILLSIGTGHNGAETNGSAEPYNRSQRRKEIVSDIYVMPTPRERKLGIATWFRHTDFVQNLSVMVSRVDNILNSEQIWVDFRNDVQSSWEASEFRRYQRINPKLGYQPPRLDDKGMLEQVQNTTRMKLRNDELYRKKVSRIAHRLVASSFYFERLGQNKHHGGYKCRGKILCKFYNGSEELRSLGSFLRRQQRQSIFQPFFRMSEQHQPHIDITMSSEIIEKMCTHAYFDMDEIDMAISANHGTTTISLAVWDYTEREDVIPISGFPRDLILDALQKRKNQQTYIIK